MVLKRKRTSTTKRKRNLTELKTEFDKIRNQDTEDTNFNAATALKIKETCKMLIFHLQAMSQSDDVNSGDVDAVSTMVRSIRTIILSIDKKFPGLGITITCC